MDCCFKTVASLVKCRVTVSFILARKQTIVVLIVRRRNKNVLLVYVKALFGENFLKNAFFREISDKVSIFWHIFIQPGS